MRDTGIEEKGSLEAESWHCRRRVGVETGGILLMRDWKWRQEVHHCREWAFRVGKSVLQRGRRIGGRERILEMIGALCNRSFQGGR